MGQIGNLDSFTSQLTNRYTPGEQQAAQQRSIQVPSTTTSTVQSGGGKTIVPEFLQALENLGPGPVQPLQDTLNSVPENAEHVGRRM
jgi:hypothetical protein